MNEFDTRLLMSWAISMMVIGIIGIWHRTDITFGLASLGIYSIGVFAYIHLGKKKAVKK